MYRSPWAKLSSFSTPYTIEKPSATREYSAPTTMPLTSSEKKKLIRFESAHRQAALRRAGLWPARRGGSYSSADQPGISWYLPAESILNRKNLPFTRSPFESKLIGWPRIEVDSLVFLIAARTLSRLGVWPALQTEAMASSITCVAAKIGRASCRERV